MIACCWCGLGCAGYAVAPVGRFATLMSISDNVYVAVFYEIDQANSETSQAMRTYLGFFFPAGDEGPCYGVFGDCLTCCASTPHEVSAEAGLLSVEVTCLGSQFRSGFRVNKGTDCHRGSVASSSASSSASTASASSACTRPERISSTRRRNSARHASLTSPAGLLGAPVASRIALIRSAYPHGRQRTHRD